MTIMTELVTMESVATVKKEEFIAIVEDLEKNFHSKQPRFMNTELLYDEKNDVWIMIQHWETKEHLKTASRKMFNDSAAEAFVKSITPGSVKIITAPQVKTWE